MKIVKRLFLVGIVLVVFRIVLPFIEFYPFQLTKEFYLVGKGYWNDSFSIRKGIFGKDLLEMSRNSEWMINDDFVYGNKGKSSKTKAFKKYFLIDRKTNEVIEFNSLIEMNTYLKSINVKPYDMSDSENIVHLKYGLGRDRKFKE